MSTEDIQKFYRSTFDDLSIQEKLMATKGRVEFINVAIEIGNNQDLRFSVAEMQEIMDEFDEDRSVHESIEDPWVRKIMSIGWVPLGYTR
jgi:predicted Co/Zn/Cd cation transporter (cation efflux family)